MKELREISVKVPAVASTPQRKVVYAFGPYRLEPEAGVLLRNESVVPAAPKLVETLRVLVENRGSLVRKEDLMQAVWPDVFVEESNLSHNIAALRKVLGEPPDGGEYIETVSRRGYRFAAQVVRQFQEAGGGRERPGSLDFGSEELPPAQVRPGKLGRGIVLKAGAVLTVPLAAALVWLLLARSQPGAPEVVLRAAPLVALPGFAGPVAFSPEGTRVSFSWGLARSYGSSLAGGSDLHVKLIGPGEPLRLTASPTSDLSPAWSPDGRQIAFLRVVSQGRAAVLAVPALGGSERKLTEVNWTGSELFPPYLTWTPDGAQLVIVDSGDSGGTTGLFLLSLDSRERRSLTTPPAGSIGDSAPAFSPDGRTLAFIRSPSYSVGDIHLLTMSADLRPAGQPRRLTFDDRWCSGFAWAPDGRDLVFSSNRLGSFRLWRIPRTGSGQPQLLAYVGEDARSPAISARGLTGGARLVYRVHRTERNIWRAAVAHRGESPSPPVKLIASSRDDLNAEYSPDGKSIAFGSDRSGAYEIWVCAADGSRAVQLTSFGGPVTDAPRWSPDGAWIAFHSRPEGRAEIYVISSQGGTPRRLTYGPGENVVPTWSRDGKWIYFGSNRTGQHEVWKITPEGGSTVQVTKHGGIMAQESPDGKFLYYTKTRGVTSLWRVPIQGGPEAQVLGRLFYLNFALRPEGIYCIPEPVPAAQSWSIQLLGLANGTLSPVSAIEKRAVATLSVSPDGRWLLYSQYDELGNDLILVEDFR